MKLARSPGTRGIVFTVIAVTTIESTSILSCRILNKSCYLHEMVHRREFEDVLDRVTYIEKKLGIKSGV